MKMAIVADWLVTFGGAEHVLNELHALFPDAPFFTTVAKPQSLGPLKECDIRTTYLQKLYKLTKNHQVLLSLLPRAIESIDLTGYDLMISSSHAVGKGIVVPPGALHICYCHTPVRYGWEMEDDYLRDFGVPGILRNPIKKRLARLRRWDLSTAQRTDLFIANSTTTQERIKRIYGRSSIVIPPPVEERFFEAASGQRLAGSLQEQANRYPLPAYYLAVGRLVPYKRFDLLIELANKLQLPLKIAGRGQDEKRLKALAGPTVELLGFVSDEELMELYSNAKALLFPQYEDAGIVLLEAQACGTPAIAYGAGGAKDAVKENVSGVFFEKQTIESLESALKRFEEISWDREKIRAHAGQFRQSIFQKRMMDCVKSAYDEFKAGKFIRQ
jgi:glycosyltransferase involved in cell wall biosynthesis